MRTQTVVPTFAPTAMLAAITACAWPVLAETSLLTGGGFEGLGPRPAGWRITAAAGAVGEAGVSGEMARSGRQSLHVRKTNGRGFFTADLIQRIAVQPGVELELRGYVHVAAASWASRTYFVIRQYPAASNKYLPPNIFSSNDQRVAIRCRPGEWSIRSTTFTARPTAAWVEVTIVVAGNPCDIYWDDIYLGPPVKPTLRLPRLEPQELLSEQEALQRLAARPMATGEVRAVDGQPQLLIDGKPTAPLLHLMCFWRPFTSYNGDFGRQGVHIHVCPIVLAPNLADGSHLWKGRGEYDFTQADQVLLYALRADPDAYLAPDLCLIGAYPGWGEEHPDEVCQDAGGARAIGKSVHNTRYGLKLQDPREFWCPSYFSQVYRRDAEQVIADYIAHLRSTPFFRAVVGFSITGGDDGQFSLWRRSGPQHEPDYSPAAVQGFRRFLRARYGDDLGLRHAWGDEQASLAAVSLPSPAERKQGGFRDPRTDGRLADYHRFLSEGTAEMVIDFASTAKAAAGKPVFCTTYWGAHTMGGMDANHWGLRRLLASDAIDVLHAPAGYGPWRRPGWTGACHGVPGSLRLHEKLYLQELDLRTYTRGYRDEAYGYFLAWAADSQQFDSIYRREIGMMLAWGQGAWHYDMAGGWFHDPAILQRVRDAVAAWQSGRSRRDEWRPDVAVLVDEESAHWLARDAFHSLFVSVNPQRAALALSGTPYDLYLTDDLQHPDLAGYKVYVFLNAYRLTARQAAFIQSKLQRSGKTLVWMYAPGYLSDDGPSVRAVSRLTGMQVKASTERQSLACESVASEHTLARGLTPLLGDSTNAARFWIDDSQSAVVGRYLTDGKPAVAAREFADWRSVYVAAPGCLTPELMHNIARWAGAYTVSAPGDAVYMNGRFLCVHGVVGGRRRFLLPGVRTVTDMVTGKVVVRNASTFTADVPLQSTRWFALD